MTTIVKSYRPLSKVAEKNLTRGLPRKLNTVERGEILEVCNIAEVKVQPDNGKPEFIQYYLHTSIGEFISFSSQKLADLVTDDLSDSDSGTVQYLTKHYKTSKGFTGTTLEIVEQDTVPTSWTK